MSEESEITRLPAPARSDPSQLFEIFLNERGRWQAWRADGMVLGHPFRPARMRRAGLAHDHRP